MNLQSQEAQDQHPHGALDVHSVFLTIQGEGPFVGRRATFVRLAGCNLQCPLCDTDYTSRRLRVAPLSLLDWVDRVDGGDTRTGLVVITGGEPFRQNIGPFIDQLLLAGYQVQLETNGTLYQPLPYSLITVVCSPKTGRIHPRLRPHIAALKYVVQASAVDPVDLLPMTALGHPSTPKLARPLDNFAGIIYVQPADEGHPDAYDRNLTAAIKAVLSQDYRLCLQTHKLTGME